MSKIIPLTRLKIEDVKTYVNFENVTHFYKLQDFTRIYFNNSSDINIIAVHETPEQILELLNKQ